MKKRQFKRFPVSLNATVVSSGRNYEGIIGNVSEEGVAYNLSTFIQTATHFTPQKTIELILAIPSGDTVNLKCEIRWFLRPLEGKNTLILGMKIMEPPPKYREWIKMSNRLNANEKIEIPEDTCCGGVMTRIVMK